MYSLKKTQSRFAYIPWLQQLVDNGELVEVRGKETLEFLNCVTEITEPWHHCILIPSRRWNPFLALSESLWILAGRDDVEALLPYNSHISDYSDNGSTLYGAYGKRIYHQIDPLVERLRKDPSDRRTVLQIWYSQVHDWEEGADDLTFNTKDPPCNNLIYFKLRDNKLHMTVINRSNDLHFGLFAVNLPTFGILQSYIAARLGVEMGTQTHFSNSLHIYTDEPRAKAITERMLYNETEDMPAYPAHQKAFEIGSLDLTGLNVNHGIFSTWCSHVLGGVNTEGKSLPHYYPEFLHFADAFLRQYREHKWEPDKLAKWNEFYFDWIIAGELFISKVWK